MSKKNDLSDSRYSPDSVTLFMLALSDEVLVSIYTVAWDKVFCDQDDVDMHYSVMGRIHKELIKRGYSTLSMTPPHFFMVAMEGDTNEDSYEHPKD